jgi:hypothetical protein
LKKIKKEKKILNNTQLNNQMSSLEQQNKQATLPVPSTTSVPSINSIYNQSQVNNLQSYQYQYQTQNNRPPTNTTPNSIVDPSKIVAAAIAYQQQQQQQQQQQFNPFSHPNTMSTMMHHLMASKTNNTFNIKKEPGILSPLKVPTPTPTQTQTSTNTTNKNGSILPSINNLPLLFDTFQQKAAAAAAVNFNQNYDNTNNSQYQQYQQYQQYPQQFYYQHYNQYYNQYYQNQDQHYQQQFYNQQQQYYNQQNHDSLTKKQNLPSTTTTPPGMPIKNNKIKENSSSSSLTLMDKDKGFDSLKETQFKISQSCNLVDDFEYLK